jgi:hypothetical protein
MCEQDHMISKMKAADAESSCINELCADEYLSDEFYRAILDLVHGHLKESPKTRFLLWKSIDPNTPVTKSDGLCGYRCLLQLRLRFAQMCKEFEEAIPNELDAWMDTKLWNPEMDEFYKTVFVSFTHHASNDVLTESKATALAVFDRALSQLEMLEHVEMNNHSRASFERLNKNARKIRNLLHSAGGKKHPFIPPGFRISSELWIDITELPFFLFDQAFYCPLLVFKAVNKAPCYMELLVTNRRLNCDNHLEHNVEYGGLSFANQIANFNCSFSNAMVFVNNCHFVVQDLNSPAKETR